MPVTCKYCDKVFSRQFTLNRHVTQIHFKQVERISYAKNVWGFKCLEPDCDNSFQQGKFLINHLENVHNLKFESQTINFTNMDEFIIWKRSMEETSCSFYVVSKYKQDKNITYFNCNRSKTSHDGKQVLSKQYKRNCKSQGLCHMDSLCTSQIKIVSANDKITVKFQKNTLWA
ncbi:uncharacterized protein [Diabrotica undecimpunctata]|uniref:uncharacterized protein n=1 Tax=Diabrotica undecimpunctata TaxID=50387 RepID=UPI003B635F7A